MTKEIIVMPPQVADVKALPLISDLQFLEIATSEALNRKMLGVVNDGIRRGFNYKIGTGLKMVMGDDSGKNTACVERDGVLLTVQGQHPVEVTLPAGKESAIVIEGFYQYGVKTKQVDATSDIDSAKIIVVDSNKTADHHVILCDVTVPLGATQITEPMISLARRKAAGLDIQSHVDHADPHVQYVKKTFQIKTALPLKGGKDLNGTDLTLSIDTATTDRTGTVQLIDSYTSTSAVLAPTGNALRAANQRAVDKENAIQSDLNSHKSNAANPHRVTKAQVGLGSVPDYSISDIYNSNGTNFASRTALFNAYTALNKGTTDHVNNKSNPHAVTKAQVGLSAVNNWGATTAVNSTSTTTYATASAVKQAYDLATSKAANSTVTDHIGNKSNPHAVTKAQIGLGRVTDVALNWSWGTANPTHIWGSQGDDNQSYVYNGTQLKAFIGLSAVNNWGATTAVNSTSTTTYATASAVKQAYDLAASKMTQGTGDGRYFSKNGGGVNGPVETERHINSGGWGNIISSGPEAAAPLFTRHLFDRANPNVTMYAPLVTGQCRPNSGKFLSVSFGAFWDGADIDCGTLVISDVNNRDQRSWMFQRSGNAYSNTGRWVDSSDINMKENIEPLIQGKASALSKCLEFRAVTFDYINGGDKHVAGFIAQDVQKTLPGAVIEATVQGENKEPVKRLGIHHGGITALHHEAIIELKAENEILTNSLNQVRSELENLKIEIAKVLSKRG